MVKDIKKYTWFAGKIEEGKEYVVSVTFDLVNSTANIGKFAGIKTSAGDLRLSAGGKTDVVSLAEFLAEVPNFQKLITPVITKEVSDV